MLERRRIQAFSLQTKLLFFATALVLIPGGIQGVITVSSSRSALAQVVGRQLVAEARNDADRLATTVRSERERPESFAAQDVMREIRVADLDKRISSFLGSVKDGCPACVDLLVVDRGGLVVASSNPALIGATEDTTPGGRDPAATIEGPFRMAGAANTLIRFTVPVPEPDARGPMLGRLVALFDWGRGTDVIARVRENLLSVGLDADVVIIEARGIVIGGAARPNGPWQAGDRIARPRSNGEGRAATGYVDSAAGMLVGHAGLPSDLPPWTVVVAEPLSNAFAPADRTARFLATALAGALLLALAGALLAARRSLGPSPS